jgi:tRNA (guanine37-N1)-methyltransferase
MIIDVLTIFPEMFEGILQQSIIKRSIEKGIVEIRIHDFREFSQNKHKKVDDYSYGGGAGMILSLQPIVDCLRSIPNVQQAHTILTSPVGKTYTQKKAKELSKMEHLIIVCGHYEGVDDRIISYVDETVSIGDYILTGGEVASMVIVDSVVRLLKNALGNEDSTAEESFEGLLEYPQYTRPEMFEGKSVPEVLLSGDHEKIRKYRRTQALKRTYERRPDLLDKTQLTKEDVRILESIKKEES